MKPLYCLLFLQLLSGVFSQCNSYTEAPTYDNTSDALSDSSKFPLGFQRAILPNPEDMVADPCFTFTINDTSRYVEATVQLTTLSSGARICVRMGGTNMDPSCASNNAHLCGSAIADSSNVVTITVLCDNSCTTGDLEFYYRIRLSDVLPGNQDNEYWCSEQNRETPSNLLTGMFTPTVTQPTTPSGASTLHMLSLPLLLAIATIAGLWKYIY